MGRRRFSPGVEAQHYRVDADEYENVYVVGDVHGCRATAEALLDELAPAPDELVVFVGDLVRRGPDSRGVVDLVRSRPNLTSVRGNNEEKIVTGRRPADGLGLADIRWLRSLPAVVSWADNLVVHGGVRPNRSLDEHTLEDVQNTESVAPDGEGRPYWWERYEGPERVFFGHKVLARPYLGEHAVGLDTGCVYGGALTAYDTARDRTVSVEPDRSHRDRPPEKFLDPYGPASS
jgi:serine/threonine protein phosphatase 1